MPTSLSFGDGRFISDIGLTVGRVFRIEKERIGNNFYNISFGTPLSSSPYHHRESLKLRVVYVDLVIGFGCFIFERVEFYRELHIELKKSSLFEFVQATNNSALLKLTYLIRKSNQN